MKKSFHRISLEFPCEQQIWVVHFTVHINSEGSFL